MTLGLLKANFGITLSMQVYNVYLNFTEICQCKLILVYVRVFYYPYRKQRIGGTSLFDVKAFRAEGLFV